MTVCLTLRVKALVLCCLCLSLLLSAPHAAAQSAFTGTQGDVTRSSRQLYGGTLEVLRIASNGGLYAGLSSPNGIFCSSDGAQTWSGPPAGTDMGSVSDVAIGSMPTTVFAIGGIDLYRSTDACLTWAKIGEGQGVTDVGGSLLGAQGTLLVALRNGQIGRSTDDGETFALVSVDSEVTWVRTFASSPTAGEFYLIANASDSFALYRSQDYGLTWHQTGKSGGNYSSIGVNPSDGEEIVLAGLDLAEISTDGGLGWSTITPGGMPKSTIGYYSNRLYVGPNWSTDGGATWHNLGAEAVSYDTDLLGGVVADPSTPSTLYMMSSRGVARSTDNGLNWHDLVEGIAGVRVNGILQLLDKNTVFLGAQAGIARTTDFLGESATWTYPIKVESRGSSVDAITLSPANPDLLIAAAGGRIYYSEDSGTTWSEATAPLVNRESVRRLASTSEGNIYASYGNSDANSGGVLASGDGGITWSNISSGAFDLDCHALAASETRVFVGVGEENDADAAKRGIYQYDGAGWTQLGGEISGHLVNDIIVAGGVVFAATGGGPEGSVFRSTDNGGTWENLASRGITDDHGWYRTLAYDPADPSVIFAAHGRPAGNAIIFQSTDAGDSWSTYYEGLKDEVPSAMLVDDLLTGFQTGLYEFSAAEYSLSAQVSGRGRRRRLSCTLLKSSVAESGAQLTIERKRRRKTTFGVWRTATSDATGQISVRKPKAKFHYRCSYQTPGGKTVQSEMVRGRASRVAKPG